MYFQYFKYIFGPVNFRRLGRSLGVNNILYKTCSYSSVYCQLGRTTNLTIERRSFFNAKDIVEEVYMFINEVNGKINYTSFVPDGEPLLDIEIGRMINGIKERIEKPVAIFTNSPHLFLEDADLVSIKIDGVSIKNEKHNRQHPRLARYRLALTLTEVEDQILVKQ